MLRAFCNMVLNTGFGAVLIWMFSSSATPFLDFWNGLRRDTGKYFPYVLASAGIIPACFMIAGVVIHALDMPVVEIDVATGNCVRVIVNDHGREAVLPCGSLASDARYQEVPIAPEWLRKEAQMASP